MDNSILIPIAEAVSRTGLSRSYLYMRLADGSIESVKAGKRRLVIAASLNQWAANLPTSQLKQSTASKETSCR